MGLCVEKLNRLTLTITAQKYNCITHSGRTVLGPILYAIFVALMYELEDMSSFADDNYTIRWHSDLQTMIQNLETLLTRTTKWLKDSGLVVNETKTEVCLFSRQDIGPVRICINGTQLLTQNTISVLGLIFDSKLSWGPQVSNANSKSTKAVFLTT